ncbi:uncharacterized protein LOC135339907 isoform X2 [Halichondria panicea]|uniref:uncharacterized protein LOC135339907 isoform X2 n=1 Tax=Halichondria panicea TaxID=6063 RepID=UPI00312B952D
MFGGLQSFYLQRKYFRENFQLVESTPVTLGSHLEWKMRRVRKKAVRMYDRFYYVPLLKSLKALLRKNDIQEEVYRMHGVLRDVMDGAYAKGASQTNELRLAFYHDELELFSIGRY